MMSAVIIMDHAEYRRPFSNNEVAILALLV